MSFRFGPVAAAMAADERPTGRARAARPAPARSWRRLATNCSDIAALPPHSLSGFFSAGRQAKARESSTFSFSLRPLKALASDANPRSLSTDDGLFTGLSPSDPQSIAQNCQPRRARPSPGIAGWTSRRSFGGGIDRQLDERCLPEDRHELTNGRDDLSRSRRRRAH